MIEIIQEGWCKEHNCQIVTVQYPKGFRSEQPKIIFEYICIESLKEQCKEIMAKIST